MVGVCGTKDDLIIDLKELEKTMKNILFLVTGMTPQIITETVWALACDPSRQEKWIPDEIYVLTTQHGFNLINTRLLEKGIFDRLKQDYPQLEKIKFDKSQIDVITCDDKPLADLKTPKDNELTADLICEKVRKFTQDDDVCLYVSIAGGRKTMGFYAGYALSLYGRSQDKMSHILAEEDFENVPDFYYPTPYDLMVTNNKGNSLNAKNAKVWLADIPFVRLRSSLGANAMVHHQKFSDVVNLLNINLSSIKLLLNIKKRTIQINDMVCKLTPKEFGIYLLVVKLLQNDEVLYYPSKEIDGDTIGDKHQKLFNDIYGKYKTKDDVVVDFDYLSQTLSYIKRKMIANFGVEIFNKIGIQDMGNGYGLNLSPNQIVIE